MSADPQGPAKVCSHALLKLVCPVWPAPFAGIEVVPTVPSSYLVSKSPYKNNNVSYMYACFQVGTVGTVGTAYYYQEVAVFPLPHRGRNKSTGGRNILLISPLHVPTSVPIAFPPVCQKAAPHPHLVRAGPLVALFSQAQIEHFSY